MQKLSGRLLMLGMAACLAGGCARRAATTAAPHQEELPVIERPEQIVPAAIGVEGRREERHVALVPKFEEPELTEEERRALGEKPEPINWLEFYVPAPKVLRVWPDFGGGDIGSAGWGGHVTGVHGPRRAVSVERRRRPVATGYTPMATCAGRAVRPERPVAAAASDTSRGVRVGEGRASHVAGRETRAGK